MTARRDHVLAGTVVVLGILLAAGATRIDTGFGYDRIGPRTVPVGVALGLVLLGGALALDASKRRPDTAAVAATPIRWDAVALVALACLLFVALVGRTGFIVAASLQFWLVARSFSTHRPFRDAGVAVVLTAVVYVAFTRGLGLALPERFVESLF